MNHTSSLAPPTQHICHCGSIFVFRPFSLPPLPSQAVSNLSIEVVHFSQEKEPKKPTSKLLQNIFFLVYVVNIIFPCSVHLEPVLVELVGRRTGEKPLVLVNSNPANENDEVRENISRSPWESVAEDVWPDLLSSFEIVRNKMECENLGEVKPSLVARFGKILFSGSPSCGLEGVRKDEVAETTLRQLRRSFYTNIPSSYMENIVSGAVPMIGFDPVDEKEIFHVKLSGSSRPDSTISCKCSVKEDKTLELYKVELNQVRQMVVDVSCVHKNLDLRLMLCSKRILTALTDDEMHSIRNLINSAVLDPEVKGGAGVGEATIEVTLKLKRIVSDLQEDKVETDSILDMFKDNLKMIWGHFLGSDPFLA
ncbi:hypothetical protein QYF36_012974 [Acer negundo]|nr:hypothetical protein QYF36_012974 [Acer negundo]